MGSGTEDRPSRRPRARACYGPMPRFPRRRKGSWLAASSRRAGAWAAAWEGPPSRGPSGTQELVGEGPTP
jgi:hypothetical protein